MCNNCIHKIVCSKHIACGEVKSCEHFKEERKGRWVKRQFADDCTTAYRCSECHTTWDANTNYCPHCGADMRGNNDEKTE